MLHMAYFVIMYKLISLITVKTLYGEIEVVVYLFSDLKRACFYLSFHCID
jgi:hypothetical protein